MRLRWILMTVLAGGAGYFALFGGDYGYFEVRRLERERGAEIERLRDLHSELRSLRARTDSLEQDSATIERVAREKFGLIRNGERLYRFVDSVNVDSGNASPRRR